MLLVVVPPSGVNASPKEEGISKLHFYKGRLSVDGPLITVTGEGNEILDRVLLRVSKQGKISLNRLTEELSDAELASGNVEETNE